MRKISPRDIRGNMIDLIEKQWMLVAAGNIGSFNMMTANWGAMGELWFKDVAFVFIRPQRHTFKFTEQENIMTLSFFGEEHRKALQVCGSVSGRDTDKVAATGLTPYETENGSVAFREAEMVMECRKLYADTMDKEGFLDPAVITRCYPGGDFHRMYVVEILNVWVK